jgi:NOL1/NOP2/fmu family ribosome biogenesis protein
MGCMLVVSETRAAIDVSEREAQSFTNGQNVQMKEGMKSG